MYLTFTNGSVMVFRGVPKTLYRAFVATTKRQRFSMTPDDFFKRHVILAYPSETIAPPARRNIVISPPEKWTLATAEDMEELSKSFSEL
jgi:hypothetical protein